MSGSALKSRIGRGDLALNRPMRWPMRWTLGLAVAVGLAVILSMVLSCPTAWAEGKKLDLGEPANADWRRAMRQDKITDSGKPKPQTQAKTANRTGFSPYQAPVATEQAKPRSLTSDEETQRAKAKPQVGVSLPF